MKHRNAFYILTALCVSVPAQAQQATQSQTFGILGCGLDGKVKFADLRDDHTPLSDTLVGQSCLGVLGTLGQGDVRIGAAVPARLDEEVPDEIKDTLFFDIQGAVPATTKAHESVFCKLDNTSQKLVVVGSNVLSNPPVPGDSCTDELAARHTGGSEVRPPVAGLLDPGSESMTNAIEECLIFDLAGAGMDVRKEKTTNAQLICDYEAGNLTVVALHQNGKFLDSITIGESCATARDELRKAGLVEKGEPIVASSDMTLVYPIFSDRPEGRQVPFWEQNPEEPANGDIEVYTGDSTDPSSLIWKIEDSTTSVILPDPTGGETLKPINTVVANGIVSPTGDLLCQAVDAGNQSFQLLSADGQVLLTEWGKFHVFAGWPEFPSVGSQGWNKVLGDVLFSFKGNQMFAGRWPEGPILITVSAEVGNANPMRQLLLSALALGKCGSSGL